MSRIVTRSDREPRRSGVTMQFLEKIYVAWHTDGRTYR
jgi:hypothetical protein